MMKYNLKQIADAVEDVTGITLSRMKQKLSYSEVVAARTLYIILSLDNGIWGLKQEITDFINQSESGISYSKKKRFTIIRLLRICEDKLIENSKIKVHELSPLIKHFTYNQRISVINDMIKELPEEFQKEIKIL